MPVPAGMRRPTMTFSLRPRRWSTRPAMLASVSTRVVSWNEAAEMKLSVDSGRLGDAEEERGAVGGFAAAVHHFLVLFHEAETIDLLVDEEVRIADAGHADGTEHLAADHFDVLIVDGNGLRAVDLLDLIDQVALELLDAEDREDVVRIDRTVDERIAGAHALAFLHVDVHGTGNAVLVAGAFVGFDDDAAHALDHRTVMHRALDLGDDSLVARVTGFEELDDARQTAGDVLRLGRGARDLGQDVSRVDLVAVLHHDVGAGGKQVTLLLALFRFDGDGRRALLGGR